MNASERDSDQVVAEALREAAADYWADDSHPHTRYGDVRDWLLRRADEIAGGGTNGC